MALQSPELLQHHSLWDTWISLLKYSLLLLFSRLLFRLWQTGNRNDINGYKWIAKGALSKNLNLVYVSVWLALNVGSHAFISRREGMCTVALNRPPTQNWDHINPPDSSADGNTNVCFWCGVAINSKSLPCFSRGVSRPYLGLSISLAGVGVSCRSCGFHYLGKRRN